MDKKILKQQLIIKLSAILIAVFVFISNSFAASEIELSQTVSDNNIKFEDSLLFEIKLTWEGSPLDYIFDKPLKPSFDRLKIGRFSTTVGSKIVDNKEITTKTFSYTLSPTLAGKGLIDPVTIHYLNRVDSLPGELVSQGLAVDIAYPVKKEEPKKSNLIPILSVIIGLIIVVVIVIIYLKKKNKPVEIKKTPKEQFLDNLTEQKKIAENDFKKYQSALHMLLREYLKASHNIEINNLSEDQLEKILKETKLSDKQIIQLKEWIIKAEKDKYAPVKSAPGDLIRLDSEIRTFFENI